MTPTDYADKTPATTAESSFVFYDIESLHNLFTVAAYRADDASVNLFYLLDEPDGPGSVDNASLHAGLHSSHGGEVILGANPALLSRYREIHPDRQSDIPPIRFFDLRQEDSAQRLAQVLTGVVPTKGADIHTRKTAPIGGQDIICDTSPVYDHRVHSFVAGYNSNQYDTTMLALFFSLAYDEENNHVGTTAKELREHNDAIFDMIRKPDANGDKQSMPSYLREHPRAATIRRNWLASGRHFDVARLNELQQRVALKRLLGMLGHQVLESERLSGPGARVDTVDEALDLIAYNISDTVGTAMLMNHPAYAGSFDLRAGLLRTYPETVFDRKGGNDFRTPVLDTSRVLNRWPRGRLTIDTSSAQFAGRILAPYRDLRAIPGHVGDLPVVSFRYPDPLRRDTNAPWPENVLTQSRDFFFATVPHDTAVGRAAHEDFKKIYDYYRSIEGLSFNHVDHAEARPQQVLVRIIDVLREAMTGTEDPIGARDALLALHSVIGDDRPKQMEPGEDPSPLLQNFTHGQFLDMFEQLCTWVGKNAPDDEVLRADLLRLMVIEQAWCDSAQPYWPQDRPALRDTVITYSQDPRHWRNDSHELASVRRPPANVPYFTADGSPTSCFATFSTGGIHGAEANTELLAHHNLASQQRWAKFYADLNAVHIDWRAAVQTAQGPAPSAEIDPSIEVPLEGEKKVSTRARVNRARKAAQAQVDAHAKLVAQVQTCEDWVRDNAHTMPEILGPNGVPFGKTYLAEIAYWLRSQIRVRTDELGPKTGEQRVIEWGELLESSSKKNNPVLRSVPKNERGTSAKLFVAKDSQEVPLVPPAPAGTDNAHADTKLDRRYRHTSVDDVIHEDFTSYYPLMLVNLAAFANPDLTAPGEPARDKYREIFADKERYGKLMKQPGITAEQKQRYGVLRNGVKLILNAASGAADARHETPILMNNAIITMRIVGQLFSWRIGQAQTFAGGRIVSTNTDGLYSTLDDETNQRVLDEHTAAINVEIEPEPLSLVSKDSNNRVEFGPIANGQQPWEREVLSAGGGTLACWDGPDPRKALAHPAMTDRLLLEYFRLVSSRYAPAGKEALRIDEPMDRDVVDEIVSRLHEKLGVRELLRFYQNMLASSPSTNSYLFAAPYRCDPVTGAPLPATDTGTLTFSGDTRAVLGVEEELLDANAARREHARPVHLIGHYTRVFSVDPEKVRALEVLGEPVVIADARASSVSADRLAQRRANEIVAPVDPVAAYLLGCAGESPKALRQIKDIKLTQHAGVDTTSAMLVFNHTILDHPDEDLLRSLLDCIDVEDYIGMAVESYELNWRNQRPGD